jgi:AAA15 family ATPase/GTPase
LEDSELKQKVVNELRNGDFNIVDIKTEVEEKPMPEGFIENLISLNPNITEEQKEELKKVNTIRATKTEFAHKVIDDKGQESNYFLPRGLESQGTIRMFGIATVLKTITKKDSFITIDEIESSMHPRLVEYIITEFLNEESNSQLLVTTHYDGLLEEKDLIRNDAIWFTSKKDNGATDLYPLSDFRGLSRISSLRKAYRVNSFGAQPNI